MQAFGRKVFVLAFPRAQLLDIAGPVDAFNTVNGFAAEAGRPAPYEVTVVSAGGGLVETFGGLGVQTQALPEVRPGLDTLLVAGGIGVYGAIRTPGLVDWVKAQAGGARRVCSVCSGAFLLAEAGLLRGKRATTHWSVSERLRSRHPDVLVEPDSIFIADGDVWTSAGITAGIDLALALIEQDLGRKVAIEAARELVVFLKRPGGQAQFSTALALQAGDGAFGGLHDWMRANLAADLRVERLAEQAGMSPRTFARTYVGKMGVTPASAVEQLRLEAARQALEDTDHSVKQIARDVGFGDDERMRRSFLRHLSVTPSDYRERFSRPAA